MNSRASSKFSEEFCRHAVRMALDHEPEVASRWEGFEPINGYGQSPKSPARPTHRDGTSRAIAFT